MRPAIPLLAAGRHESGGYHLGYASNDTRLKYWIFFEKNKF